MSILRCACGTALLMEDGRWACPGGHTSMSPEEAEREPERVQRAQWLAQGRDPATGPRLNLEELTRIVEWCVKHRVKHVRCGDVEMTMRDDDENPGGFVVHPVATSTSHAEQVRRAESPHARIRREAGKLG